MFVPHVVKSMYTSSPVPVTLNWSAYAKAIDFVLPFQAFPPMPESKCLNSTATGAGMDTPFDDPMSTDRGGRMGIATPSSEVVGTFVEEVRWLTCHPPRLVI